jgi:hypothetical protein
MPTLTETGRFVFRSLSEIGEIIYGIDDTVREKILDNIKATLDSVLVANGYDNDLSSVQRWKQNGNDLKDIPAVIVKAGPENTVDNKFPLTTCKMTVFLDLWIRENEDAANDTDEKLNSLLGDIKKALKVDITRGGFAVDTFIGSILPFEIVEGEPHAGLIIETEIHYRHRQTDPKVAG